MKQFLIGQYGEFCYKKLNRDFKSDFYGIENCLFKDDKDIENLIYESRKLQFKVGIHFPLKNKSLKIRDALILSKNEDERNLSYQLIQEELEQYVPKVKPEYILFHYPKPVILDDNLDWSLWKFANQSEYIFESEFSFDECKSRSKEFFEWISEQGRKYDFIPILEFDALNKYITETDLLQTLLEDYSNIRLCLDTCRLYYQELIDPNFDSVKIFKRFIKYAHLVHLSNLKFEKEIVKYKYPVLPNQLPEDGWAPIQSYLHIIRDENLTVKILFEHRSDLISEEELEICYSWVKENISKRR